MSIPTLQLKPGKEQSLQRFHPWIFSGAVKSTIGEPSEGDVVNVQSSTGKFLAIGHYQPSSIMVRVLSFREEPINGEFWRKRLTTAIELRRQLGLFDNQNTNIFRLIHGEGDGLPGLVVDLYGKTAVIQAHSAGMYLEREAIANLLVELTEGGVEAVYDKSKGTLPFKSPVQASNGYLVGGVLEDELREHGHRFLVSWEEGQKTGFFVDQRENRLLLKQYSKDALVLNTFGYTGGFSIYALLGGAKRVVTVDSSQKALDLTDRNVELNADANRQHQSVCTDAFEYLKKERTLQDIIILDPPAFAKHNSALRNALQAYKRLNAEAMARLKPGGILFTFSCSQIVSREQFRNAVFSGGVIANRQVKILHQLTQPADHPISIYHPEGEYLKGLALRVE